MPAAVTSIERSRRPGACRAVWSLLEMALPGARSVPLGILMVDEDTGRLTLRLRDSAAANEAADGTLEEEQTDILDFLGRDLAAKAREAGGGAVLDALENSLSHFLRIGDRTPVAYAGDPAATVDRLFDEYVDASVRPFVTHLPLYSLRAAATRFGEGMQSEQEGWVRAAVSGMPRLLLTEDMFVARVVGRSMEPLIPDGSLCIFRAGVAGTRQGKRLLIEQFGETDFSARYTVKRYTSVKRVPKGAANDEDGEDGGWEHERIRLEPLNREFAAFDLGPDEFRVIAEFVAVLS